MRSNFYSGESKNSGTWQLHSYLRSIPLSDILIRGVDCISMFISHFTFENNLNGPY